LRASRLADGNEFDWIIVPGRIESLAPTLKDAAACPKYSPLGARHSKGDALETSRRPVVLAVEDEPLILMLAIDMIRDAGFEALWASNADDAIRILESRNDIRIVFTDINMPGSMDGIKLAQAVRGRWPPIRIIATSGFSGGELKLLPEGSQFIPKPYSAGQISDALHSLAA
jgi:two-component system, response regulator PdtaR